MIVNLDKLSADFSQKILSLMGRRVKEDKIIKPDDIKRICSSALGVLQEQGVYAVFLFLLSRSGERPEQEELSTEEFAACGVVAHLVSLLNTNELKGIGCTYVNNWDENFGRVNACKSELLRHMSQTVACDLRKLLMLKSLYEQVLVYTKYGADALSISEA